MNLFPILIPIFSFLINKFSGIVSIFFLMRLCSVIYSRKYIDSKKQVISYLLFFPEMITGPHRDFKNWNIPYLNFESFNLINLIEFLFFINIILGSGYIFGLYSINFDYVIFNILITYFTLFIQFLSTCRIINLISELFGQKRINNFNNPFNSISITDFWTRWHISLGFFTKKYVSQPITYYLKKRNFSTEKAYILSTFVSFLFIAIWHKFSIPYIIFGIYYGTIVIFERLYLKDYFKILSSSNLKSFICKSYCQIVFLLGFSLIFKDINNVIIHP